ncbi:MAG TPA: hypothetical protein VE642_01090 [Pyrinomonadaceae bacterium]|jgi:hypothetical protein|nr:hypothetical protein [Pyrinomonadaceae bacterium]
MEEKIQHAKPALVFVYNAESGVFNALADAAHKIFSPRTYACNLCALTHTALGMRGEWRRFLEGLGVPLEFLHADELRARYGVEGAPLPAVFERDGVGLRVLAGADAINACATLDDLKRLVIEARDGARESRPHANGG